MNAIQLLQKIEWHMVNEHRSVCLYCHRHERQGHKPDCPLPAVLSGAERDDLTIELHRCRRELAILRAQESMRGGREKLTK